MDPISDMFIRIKNAYRAGHEAVVIPYSKFKYEIAKTLERSGFVGKVDRKGKRVRKVLEVALKYNAEGEPAVSGVRLISKPSRRFYTSYSDIRRAEYGGSWIISTPQGVMSGPEAKKAKVGGELIAEIW